MIAIVNTGGANLRSIENSISRITDNYLITDDLKQIERAAKIILPGVGNVDKIMTRMNEKGLCDYIRKTKKPVLGICIGMQILFSKSEEGKEPCLDIMKDEVIGLQSKKLPIPHMGWNNVEQNSSHPLWSNVKNNDRFYFVHSYFVNESDQSIVQGLTNYNVSFTSAVAKDNLFAVQFHPEKSGDAGLKILSNFVSWKC